MTTFKRRKYFIDKRFQAKFILMTILGLVVYTLLFLAIIFVPIMLPIGSDLSLAEQAESARIFLLLHSHIWPAVGIVIVIMGVVSIFVSHKVAGPVYRLSTSMKQVTAGDLSINVELRRGDDMQSLAEQINLHLVELRDFVKTLKNDQQQLAAAIEEIEDDGQAGAGGVISPEGVKRLQQVRGKLAADLERFNLG